MVQIIKLDGMEDSLAVDKGSISPIHMDEVERMSEMGKSVQEIYDYLKRFYL